MNSQYVVGFFEVIVDTEATRYRLLAPAPPGRPRELLRRAFESFYEARSHAEELDVAIRMASSGLARQPSEEPVS